MLPFPSKVSAEICYCDAEIWNEAIGVSPFERETWNTMWTPMKRKKISVTLKLNSSVFNKPRSEYSSHQARKIYSFSQAYTSFQFFSKYEELYDSSRKFVWILSFDKPIFQVFINAITIYSFPERKDHDQPVKKKPLQMYTFYNYLRKFHTSRSTSATKCANKVQNEAVQVWQLVLLMLNARRALSSDKKRRKEKDIWENLLQNSHCYSALRNYKCRISQTNHITGTQIWLKC